MTYTGPTPTIADFPGQRVEEGFIGVFRLSDADRQRIAEGANLELFVGACPIPPIAIDVTDATEQPAEDDLRCVGCDALYVKDRGLDACGQCGAKLVPAADL